MKQEDETTVLRADRENLHQRNRELLAENERVKAEIESLRLQLATEKEITANLTWAIEQTQKSR